MLFAGAAAPLFLGLLALAPSADKVSFHAAKGLSVTRTITAEHTLEMEDMTVLINGAEPPAMPEMSMEMDIKSSYKIADTYAEMGPSAPAKLVRKFEQLDQNIQMSMTGVPGMEPETNLEGLSDLEGKTVVFAWDEEAKSYKKTYEGEAGEEGHLDGLQEDMDLRFLLPERAEVSVDDTWSPSMDRLRELFMPGGDFKIAPEASQNSMGMQPGQNSDQMFRGDWEGTCKATYKGLRDGHGVIHVVIDAKVKTDATESAKGQMGELPGGAQATVDHVDLLLEITCEGDLLWNLADGIPASLNMEGKMKINNESSIQIAAGGQNMDMENIVVMAGGFSMKMEFAKN